MPMAAAMRAVVTAAAAPRSSRLVWGKGKDGRLLLLGRLLLRRRRWWCWGDCDDVEEDRRCS